MKNYIISIFIFLSYSCNEIKIPKDTVLLELQLDGRKYKQLKLFAEVNLNGPIFGEEIEGFSEDGYNWRFYIPDSINNKIEAYLIKTQDFDFLNNRDGMLSFSNTKISSKAKSAVHFSEKKFIIKGKYLKTRERSYEGLAYLLVDTFVESPTISYDLYDVVIPQKKYYSDFELSLLFPDFDSLVIDGYKKELAKRIGLVKKYPQSKYLFDNIITITGYKNKEDMKLVFDNFSDSLKNSQQGKQMMEYLTEIVELAALDTTKLLNTKTKQSELIIEDSSKYTLVIFSASWCGPCHKQIPLLKGIYNDLGKKLNIVYISIDHKNDIDSWNKLIEKENIPWRSLFADEKYKGLKEKYSIAGIPHSILIYPNGKEEKIDVRNNSEKEKLYNLVEAIK